MKYYLGTTDHFDRYATGDFNSTNEAYDAAKSFAKSQSIPVTLSDQHARIVNQFDSNGLEVTNV